MYVQKWVTWSYGEKWGQIQYCSTATFCFSSLQNKVRLPFFFSFARFFGSSLLPYKTSFCVRVFFFFMVTTIVFMCTQKLGSVHSLVSKKWCIDLLLKWKIQFTLYLSCQDATYFVCLIDSRKWLTGKQKKVNIPVKVCLFFGLSLYDKHGNHTRPWNYFAANKCP